jgi:tetratricopeptide (TPR) repeat protein
MELDKIMEFNVADEFEDFGNFEMKVDKVYKMLEELTCNDETKVKEAEGKIDKFLAETKAEEARNFVKVTSDRTMINKDVSDLDKKADEYKQQGNEAFRKGQYKKSVELYTSALMVKDDNHILYTNRAQALIKLGRYFDASTDCRKAIKLKPDSVKGYIHLAKALKEQGEFQEAIDILERAEDIAQDQANIVKKYKMDMIEEQKRAFIINKDL